MVKQFEIDGKTIRVYGEESFQRGTPIIYLNAFENEGEEVFSKCKQLTDKDFALVEISISDWNKDLSPWLMEGIAKGDKPFLGEGDDHIRFIADRLAPFINMELGIKGSMNIIAGYSLAGLFAFYSLYKTDLFDKAVCCSSSFWYEGFEEFAYSSSFLKKPESLYLSLGNKESKTKNPTLSKVGKNTESLYSLCVKRDIKTILEYNEGGHFKDASFRVAKGIKWILEN